MKIYASDPGYSVVEELWRLYAIAANPHAWMNDNDMSDPERYALMDELRSHMQDLIDGLPPVYVEAVTRIDDIID